MSKYGLRGLLVLCLSMMVSSSYGVVIGDFEGGDISPWYAAGWNAGDSATSVEEYATLGDYSMKGVIADGGWVEIAEVGLLDVDPALQTILGTYGQVTIDVTPIATDAAIDWCQMGLLINRSGDSGWNSFGWQDLVIGQTQSITFDLTADEMTAILAVDPETWLNLGFIGNSPNTTLSDPDPITGEQTVLVDGEITYYIDNVQIVPEPATMTMVGLGALALIRKRK